MSSFICNPEHFNSVENAVINLYYSNSFCLPYSLKDIFSKWYYKRNGYKAQDVEKEIKDVFNTIRELSVLCVNLQYAHHSKDLNGDIKAQTKHLLKNNKNFETLNKIGCLKALECIIYQIEPEHLQSLRKLTKEEENALLALNELRISLQSHIIQNLDEYRSAKYSI